MLHPWKTTRIFPLPLARKHESRFPFALKQQRLRHTGIDRPPESQLNDLEILHSSTVTNQMGPHERLNGYFSSVLFILILLLLLLHSLIGKGEGPKVVRARASHGPRSRCLAEWKDNPSSAASLSLS